MAHLAHYREAHPTVFVVTHWINLVCMILLIFSGFYIHYPFFPGFMGPMRGTHIFLGIVLLINCVVRVIMAFTVKSAQAEGTRKVDTDVKNFLPSKQNRHQAGAWIKYYLFIKKDHPLSSKYGVPQKISYLLIPFLILFMAYTGFCLWIPTSTWGIFSAFTAAVGGAMTVRIIHYFMMWVFILFTMIHVYLANIEGFAPTKMMFLHKEHGGLTYDPDEGRITGVDNL